MKQILVFLLFAAMLCWFLFAPIYKHVLIMRQAVLQQEVDYMLEIGANGSHGYIDAAAQSASRLRLADRGFVPSNLVYTVTSQTGVSGTDSGSRVPRGGGLRLEISYPYGSLFQIDRLIGITPPPESGRMAAVGVKMSEYVP